MTTLWNFVRKYEFWFFVLIFIGLEIGDYQTGVWWMGFLANVVIITAFVRLARHPMWKKDKRNRG